MNTLTTHNIKVSVISRYESGHSHTDHNKFVHSYWIKIENKGDLDVQLLSREWHISDSRLMVREVQGEGVIGQQPIIASGSFHQYSSWCPVSSPIGKMTGRYKMRRMIDDHIFYVEVPKILFVYPPLLC